MSSNETQAADNSTPMTKQLNRQEYAIDSIFAAINELRVRLEKVLGEEPEGKESPSSQIDPTANFSSPYVRTLDHNNDMLKDASRRIEELIRRLEV